MGKGANDAILKRGRLTVAQTPIFWAQYFAAKEREPVSLEARRKNAKLQHLQRNLTALLGVGVRTDEALLFLISALFRASYWTCTHMLCNMKTRWVFFFIS
jgi:hypothetical protein